MIGYERNGAGAAVTLDRLSRVPDLISGLAAAGVRVTQVSPQHPSLEQLYRRVRQDASSRAAA